MTELMGALPGLFALALAAPALAAAIEEPAPPEQVPLALVLTAAAWAGIFAIVSCAAATSSALHVSGFLAAAAILNAAGAVWLGRSRPRGRRVPDSYWERWEAQFVGSGWDIDED